jgi:amino acid transporter
MSFDRVFAEKTGKVHPKLKAPHVALIIIMLMGFIYAWLFAYTDFAIYTALVALIGIIGYAGSGLAGMLLPYIRKDLFEISPARKWKVGGIPLVAICGFMWVLYSIVCAILFLIDPRLFVYDARAIAFFVLTYLSGAIVYFAYKAYRRKQGIDVSLVYREIPVE